MPPAKLTPAMEQYMHFKRQHQDAILFFRMGDFYEMFFDDAKQASQLLGLTLTARNNGKKAADIPLAGVPHHAMEGYVAKLIEMGRKVAICEQVEDPKQAKGVVKRDVVQVVSPGTALADSMLDQQRNNFLASLCRRQDKAGLAIVDLSTGDFLLDEMPAADLADELEALGPAELLIAEGEDESWFANIRRRLPRVAVSRSEDWNFEPRAAYETLTEQFQVHSLKGFGCDDLEVAIGAAGAAISYLRDNQRGTIEHLNHIGRKRREAYMVLDAAAQRNLDLLQNQQDGSRDNTLLQVLDHTLTPMGARMLRQWIAAPLKDPSGIDQRLDAVGALLDGRQARQALRELLRQVGDLERLMARICCQRANARDLVGLARSLAVLPDLRRHLREIESDLVQKLLAQHLPAVDELVELIGTALADEPPATLTEGGLIRDLYHDEVDELRTISKSGKDWIARRQTHERERTGIASLKIGFNQVFGYYIEVSKANLDRVPDDYIRKQTLTNAERFITPELKEYEAKVLNAEERLEELENRLFLELRQETAAWTAKVQQIARTLACLDVLASLAQVAQDENYVRPQVDAGGAIDIEAGRHPVVERHMQEGLFVPNDLHLDCDGEQILLITGPNMAGKSTIIRQVGLIVLLAQMGSFVPVRRARIGVVDRIFTRVGASDNLARGESTFMVEMNEASNILNNATSRSLILMDELGRGTSTFDGLSIAWSIVEYLHDRAEVRARTLFATHYHELTELEGTLERVRNYNVLVREDKGRIAFLHRMEAGPCDRSYGIHVAQMAGMPNAVIDRARQLLARLEGEQIDTDPLHAENHPSARASQVAEAPAARQMELFATPEPDPLAEELQNMDLSQITPLQALLKLDEWKEKITAEKEST